VFGIAPARVHRLLLAFRKSAGDRYRLTDERTRYADHLSSPEPRGQVGRLAEDGLLLGRALAHKIAHHGCSSMMSISSCGTWKEPGSRAGLPGSMSTRRRTPTR
jgi:hypothetical protein